VKFEHVSVQKSTRAAIHIMKEQNVQVCAKKVSLWEMMTMMMTMMIQISRHKYMNKYTTVNN